MPQSYIEYTSGLAGTTFSVPFKYISVDDVHALGYDGTSYVSLTVASRDHSAKTITLATAPSAYTKVRVYRSTATEQLVDFQNGSRLSEADLDTAYQQGLFVAQEVSEDANTNQYVNLADAALLANTSLSEFSSSSHTGDASEVTFDLSFVPKTSLPQAFLVIIDGVLQSPVDAYTVSVTPAQITFASAPPLDAEIVVTTTAAATGVVVDDITIEGSQVNDIVATGSTEPRSLSDRFADTVNVKDFGAVGDGVTDDTSAIQAAIDYAKSINGGTVAMPTGTFAVTSTLNFTDASGVKLVGQGGGFSADLSPESVPSTAIKYIGSSTSAAVIRINSLQSSPKKATSGGIKGIGILCNGLAGRGIYCTSVNSYSFEDITIDDPQVTGILMDCLDNKLNNGAAGGDPSDNQNNNFDQISIKSDTGTCIFLAGNDGTGSTIAANTSLNYFGQIHLNIRNNDGFVFNYSDGNSLEMLRVFQPEGFTGNGLRFDADDSGQAKHARHNVCYQIQTARAGVLAKAGNGTQPSDDNVILGFNYGNTGIDNPPVIEAGATLSYISSRLIKNLGGTLLAVSGATDVEQAATVKTQLEEIGSESLRVHNTSSNHVKLATNTQEWGMRIDSATGDLGIIGSTGANDINLAAPLKLTSQTVDTSATSGSASSLPSSPQGYLEININGVNRKIPFYA